MVKPNHHELPRYYLRGFCAPGRPSFTWVFERDRPFSRVDKRGVKNPYLCGLRRAGLRPDAYATRNPDGTVHFEAEQELQKNEHRADEVLRKVRDGEKIDPSGKDILARYIGQMLRRLTSRDEQMRRLLKKEHLPQLLLTLRGRMQELAEAGLFTEAREVGRYLEWLDSADSETWFLRKSMVRDFVWLHRLLMTMRWEFVRPAPSKYFVTTDNPVVFDRHAGLAASPLFFALGQEVMLDANRSGGDDLTYRQLSEEKTWLYNILLIQSAKCKIYSPHPDEWIYKGWTEGFSYPTVGVSK